MQKWEYYYFMSVNSNVELESQSVPESQFLNILGSQGWELVSVTVNSAYTYFYLKRPKS
jgi:hypothetical protein